jgi:hypothetical protein
LYWGIYDIRENPDEHDYTEYYYGQDKYHLYYILTWGNTWAEYGGTAALNEWDQLYNFILTNSMANGGNYKYVIDRYDATSLVDYVITNSISVCSDWLNYNTGWWRGLDSTGDHRRWGYILWDNDATFGHYINYTGIPNTGPLADPCDAEGLTGSSDPEGHIQVLNRLRQNPDFNRYYISRMIDLWNTVFSCDNMLSQLDSIRAKLTPEMAAHANRWNGTLAEWQVNMDTLRNYISARCNNLSGGLMSCYNLTGPYTITIDADPANAGSVRLNSMVLDQLPWTGTYFGGMDNIFEALPDNPYSFLNWSSNSQLFVPSASDKMMRINLNGSDSIVAHFSFTTPVFTITGNEPVANVYPTIVSTHTQLDFSLPQSLPVTVQMFDIHGKRISTFANGDYFQRGFHTLNLDMPSGSLPDGIYILKLQAGGFVKSFKLMLAGK